MTTRAVLFALLGLVIAGPLSAASVSAKTSPLTVPIAGTFPDTQNGGTGAFTGTFTPTQFINQNGSLAVVGTLTGTLTDALGSTIGTIDPTTITLPVTPASGTCQILHLDLGPLDLNLLGMQVHLNEVVLDITAQSGPGQLLGNLLYAVAHLLDSNATSGALAGLLNHILGQL